MRISDWSSDVCSSDLVPGSNTIPILPRCATTRASPAYCSDLVDPIRLHGAPDTGKLSYSPRRSPHEPTRLPARPRLHRTQPAAQAGGGLRQRSEEHTSELQSLMRISYAVFCLKKKNE